MELQPVYLQQLVYSRGIILSIMFCLFLNKVELAPNISHEEAEALLQFKAHLSTPSQALLWGWHANNTGSLCVASSAWVGVTCSLDDHLNRIQLAINLTGLGLAGSLAPHLGNLTALTSLDLSYNSLSGPIPPQLSACSSLRLLNLNVNNLSGPVPASLASLSSLQALGLCRNRLSGRMPQALFTNVTNLTKLSLCINSLTGSLPTNIASPRLSKLYLWQNYLSGPIPPSLLNCTYLKVLQLVDNAFTGPIPSQLGSLSLLEDFQVGHFKTLSDTPESEKLANPADGRTFTAGPIPESLANCTHLTTLVIDWSALTGSIPTELTKLPRLQRIAVVGNHLSGPLKFTNVSTSLYVINLESNYFTGPIPAQLGHLQGLQALDLEDNNFSGMIPWMSLSNCSSLYFLSLSQNHLHGTIPNILGRFPHLNYLYLERNLLQGGFPNFEGPSNLLGLSLSFNQLNGSLPSTGLQVSTLSYLDLSHNQLSGSLPTWLGELAMVQNLDLSYNHFEGSVPPSLGDCVALTALTLSHNRLSAELPMQLRNLRYLEALDLSSNTLSGVLPSFLGSMRRLRFLDVSFNNFTGAIPLLGIFKQLNSSFLQGNPGLCGPILNKTCPSSVDDYQHLISTHRHSMGRKAALLAIALPLLLVIALVCMVWIIMHYRAVKLAPRPTTCLLEAGAEARKYTADELTRATQGYCEESVLGEGGFAVVYKAVLADGMVVAVKKFRDVSFRKELLREVEIVSKLRHRNLVRVLGCVLNLDVNALVLQYMPNGSLLEYLDHHQAAGTYLSWRMLTELVRGVADALTYLHHEYGIPIIHGDVKPNNILLDSDFEPHLADFGLAKLVSDGAVSLSSNLMGSIGYMAPEYTYSAQVTTKVDVYSFGVVILQLLTGRKPTELPGSVSFHEWLKTKVLDDVGLQEVLHVSLSNDTNDQIAGRLLTIGLACTRDHPSDRPTMQEISTLLSCIKVE